MDFTVLRYETIDSTNTEAIRQAKLGAPEGLCITAAEQTAGRGRHGRTWSSPQGAGLYFSVILRPRLERNRLTLITVMAGVAVHDALEEFGLDADIKWVNDIHIRERKISGMLAETVETPLGTAVVLGIGVNLRVSAFPTEIAGHVTSLEAETGEVVAGAAFERLLIKSLRCFYEMLEKEPVRLVDEWCRRSSYAFGKQVRVKCSDEMILGTTEGIDHNGALRVRQNDGNLALVHAGDVERLRPVDQER